MVEIVTGKKNAGIRAVQGQMTAAGFSDRGATCAGNLAALASLPVFWELGSTPRLPGEFQAKRSRGPEIDRYTTHRLPEERSRRSSFLSRIPQGRRHRVGGSEIKQFDCFGI